MTLLEKAVGWQMNPNNLHESETSPQKRFSDDSDSKNYIEILNTDYWFKIVDYLQQNWALIEKSPTSHRCIVYFIHDLSGVFDQIPYSCRIGAINALKANGFSRYALDIEVHGALVPPPPPFYETEHPSGRIYSSGMFWTKARWRNYFNGNNNSSLTMKEALIQYSTSNGRICPQPNKWHEMWKLLPNNEQYKNGIRAPLPIILNGWDFVPGLHKCARMIEQIEYADQHGVLTEVDTFLRSLSDDEWFCIGV
jgi:hypothetical protein